MPLVVRSENCHSETDHLKMIWDRLSYQPAAWSIPIQLTESVQGLAALRTYSVIGSTISRYVFLFSGIC